MNKQYASHDIILIDREVYEYLGPLHRATADILVAKGKCRIVEDRQEDILTPPAIPTRLLPPEEEPCSAEAPHAVISPQI